ncbi:hypothetical protein DC498_17725 [Terrimonas sp.]|uniref:hypothetical protein n=1 Tax=Terrimonas sp. TaxID=1914338 RepID=UPI000D51C5B8|nr:hypothetical protein [Terrimonas sp.]PVD50812.1 hypothetical protein DC498_17725 [Terrimonas sp.]
MSDFKTKNIDEILTEIDANHDSVHAAVAKTFGIAAWYSEYISSDAFCKLPHELKRESLRVYDGVRRILRIIEQNQTHIL